MSYKRAICLTESDGYHEHVYRSGAAKVTEHLHTWIDEHLKNWPGSSRVYVGDRPYAGTAVEAWAEITGSPLPTVRCEVAP